MLNRLVLIVISLFVLSSKATSQQVLTIDSAISIALANNYDVLLAHNDAEAARLANSPGNAGMLPKLNATLSDNFSLTHLDQKLANGTETHKSNVTNNALTPSLNFSWTLFDGLKMFATKRKLNRLEEIGRLNMKDTLQTAVAQVVEAYYAVVSANQQLKSLNDAIGLYDATAKLAQKQFEVGYSSKVPMLQALVDLNASKSAAITQKKIVEQRKAALNILLARPVDVDFNTLDTIPFNNDPPSADINQIDKNNYQVMAAQRAIDVARLQKKETFSLLLPNLTVGGGTSNAGYSFSRSQSSAGFSLYNQSYGPNVGFTLTIPLFNGLVNLRQLKIADLTIQNSQYKLQKISLQNKLNYYSALKDFETAKEALAIEEDNIKLAKENADIAMERFRLAQSTAIELRQSQQSYVEAMTRLVTARYNVKTAETELMRIMGVLVK